MSPLSLADFKIQKYYKNKPTFNGVYSRNNLSEIKDGAYIINLDEFESIGTHWIDFYVNDNKVVYFDRFGVEKIRKETKKIIGKNMY